MWDLRHFPHFSTADQTTSPSMNFKYEILGPVAVCHSCPKMCPAKTFFSEGDLSINLRPSTFLPFQVHYHNVNAPLLAWTIGPNLEFSPVNVSLLEPPSSNTLIPPWSSYPCLPSALSIFSISSFSLSLSPSNERLHVHLQMQEWVLCPLCFLSL